MKTRGLFRGNTGQAYTADRAHSMAAACLVCVLWWLLTSDKLMWLERDPMTSGELISWTTVTTWPA